MNPATATPQPPDADQAIEISDRTYWIGKREGVLLECNVYLRVFRQRGNPAVNLIVDPGPPSHLTALAQKISGVIGHVSKVNLAFLNHQDPDVALNAGYLQKMNPQMSILCSEDTWRLVRFYGLDPKRFFPTERYGQQGVVLCSGHRLQFVPSPYCHFRGATMLYDLETRILYTGDLFGGISFTPGLWADESSWRGMKAFHQIYMPHRDALRFAVQNIRNLKPKPLILAPQHGALIQGKWIDEYLERIASLPVGVELFEQGRQKQNYISAMNDILAELRRAIGDAPIARALDAFRGDGTHTSLLSCANHRIQDIKISPEWSLGIFVRNLEACMPEHAGLIEIVTVKVLVDRSIPISEDAIALARGESLDTPDFLQ